MNVNAPAPSTSSSFPQSCANQCHPSARFVRCLAATSSPLDTPVLGMLEASGLALGAAVAFILAYSFFGGGILMVGFLWSLFALGACRA